MKNLKAITLVAILLLQASCLLVSDLAKLVADPASAAQIDSSEAMDTAGDILEQIEYANQD
jgi:hypothetical protein